MSDFTQPPETIAGLYRRCAPAGRVEELKLQSQRVRGTKLYPGESKSSPRDSESSRLAAPMRIWRYKRFIWRCCDGVPVR